MNLNSEAESYPRKTLPVILSGKETNPNILEGNINNSYYYSKGTSLLSLIGNLFQPILTLVLLI